MVHTQTTIDFHGARSGRASAHRCGGLRSARHNFQVTSRLAPSRQPSTPPEIAVPRELSAATACGAASGSKELGRPHSTTSTDFQADKLRLIVEDCIAHFSIFTAC